jgi:hypothetical protein
VRKKYFGVFLIDGGSAGLEKNSWGLSHRISTLVDAGMGTGKNSASLS